MGDSAPSPPQSPNASDVAGQSLAAQIQYAPQQYAAAAQYDPLYAKLSAQNTSDYLTGPGGMLSLYQNQLLPAAQQAQTSQIQSNIQNVSSMGPQAYQAQMTANPLLAQYVNSAQGNTPMAQQLNNFYSSQLALGSQLDPATQRQMQQSYAQNAAARGMGYGPQDAALESLGEMEAGQNLLWQRAGAANQYSQQQLGNLGNAANAANPLGLFTGAGANMASASNLYGQGNQGASAVPSFNPFGGLFNTIYSGDVAYSNASNAANIANSNQTNALLGSGISALGSMAGGTLAGRPWA